MPAAPRCRGDHHPDRRIPPGGQPLPDVRAIDRLDLPDRREHVRVANDQHVVHHRRLQVAKWVVRIGRGRAFISGGPSSEARTAFIIPPSFSVSAPASMGMLRKHAAASASAASTRRSSARRPW